MRLNEIDELGVKREAYHHGRCDVGSPWATGAVGNCDAVDTDLQVK